MNYIMSLFSNFLVGILSLYVFTCHAQVSEVSNNFYPLLYQGFTLKIPYYANNDLFATNNNIEKAVIVIHGTNRDADVYFRNIEAAANKISGVYDKTLLIVPQFLIEVDINKYNLDVQYPYWTDGGWKSGSNSRSESSNPRPVRIPSFTVLDSLMLHIARQFPKIKSIVFTGHSAGGQVAQRMAATSPVADLLCTDFGISTRFVTINPSSYVYMDGQRKKTNSALEFVIPTTTCSGYNLWKYGLESMYTYPESFGADSIRNMYKRRTVTYLLGLDDDDPTSSNLDLSCEAMLQGINRLERGYVYYNYIKNYFGASITERHDLVTVPNVGHNSLEMFTSNQGLNILFLRPSITCVGSISSVESNVNQEIKIYPNPASKLLYVDLPDDMDVECQVQIFNLHGQMLLSQKVKPHHPIHIESLPQGIYLLRLKNGDSIFHKRFLVL